MLVSTHRQRRSKFFAGMDACGTSLNRRMLVSTIHDDEAVIT